MSAPGTGCLGPGCGHSDNVTREKAFLLIYPFSAEGNCHVSAMGDLDYNQTVNGAHLNRALSNYDRSYSNVGDSLSARIEAV